MSDVKLPASGPGQGPFDHEIDFRGVLGFALTLLGITMASVLLMYFLFQALRARQVGLDPPPSPLVDRSVRRLPPAPRLQAQPRAELEALRAAEERVLEQYGWIDPEAGTVRIPIDRAMALTAAAAAAPAARAEEKPQP